MKSKLWKTKERSNSDLFIYFLECKVKVEKNSIDKLLVIIIVSLVFQSRYHDNFLIFFFISLTRERDTLPLMASDRLTLEHDNQGHASLSLKNVRPSDSGLYYCIARSKAGRVRCSARLNVRGEFQRDIIIIMLGQNNLSLLPAFDIQIISYHEYSVSYLRAYYRLFLMINIQTINHRRTGRGRGG